MDLFDQKLKNDLHQHAPLADRMRPLKLTEFFGQQEVIGPKSFLRQSIESDQIPSMIFWGPPGCGKTTLAEIIANTTHSKFIKLSAVASGIKDLRQVVDQALEIRKFNNQRTILFVDEIHRWNKSQQDALLPHVEKGIVTLIGATTENPSFEVISPLISRSRVFVLKKLSAIDINQILQRAIADQKFGLGLKNIKINPDTLNKLSQLANGDARMALNTLEACTNISNHITFELIKQVIQKQHLLYDKNGEEHYNIISALHKSMRGSDATAAVYWLARMLEAGEDPIYIARRMLRFAAEDIGLADNQALILANAVFESCQKIGMPECNVHLSQLAIYLSQAPKSIAAYEAYQQAQKDIKEFGNLAVPFHLRNAPTKLMKDLGYAKNYKYTPKEDSSDQKYLPDEIKDHKYI